MYAFALEPQPIQSKDSANRNRPASPASAHLAAQHGANGSGHILDTTTRNWMESRFGHQFGGVRIHTDRQAVDAAQAMNARAYTIGQDIYFGANQFRPATSEGSRLIAHELVHTLQQGPVEQHAPQAKLQDISQRGDASEREADAIADTVVHGDSSAAVSPIPVAAQRKAISRDEFQTNAGTFNLDNYNEKDTSPGNDTDKRVGVNAEIRFKSAKTVVSDKISFVQVMKTLENGTPRLFDNEKPRATEAKDGDAGWALDRVSGRKSANYGENNDGSEADNVIFGYRKSPTDSKTAWMRDPVALARKKGTALSSDASTFALDATNSKYLGGISWGFSTDAGGKTTKKTPALLSAGDPAGIQKRALERWNEQAVDPDTSKRNDPDQSKVAVP